MNHLLSTGVYRIGSVSDSDADAAYSLAQTAQIWFNLTEVHTHSEAAHIVEMNENIMKSLVRCAVRFMSHFSLMCQWIWYVW